jgi:hypothetical protein
MHLQQCVAPSAPRVTENSLLREDSQDTSRVHQCVYMQVHALLMQVDVKNGKCSSQALSSNV